MVLVFPSFHAYKCFSLYPPNSLPIIPKFPYLFLNICPSLSLHPSLYVLSLPYSIHVPTTPISTFYLSSALSLPIALSPFFSLSQYPYVPLSLPLPPLSYLVPLPPYLSPPSLPLSPSLPFSRWYLSL